MAKLTEVAAAIEKRTTQKLARGSVVLELPLYDGQYAGRFGVLADEVQAEFERAAQDPDVSRERSLEVAGELIADSCRAILARSQAGGAFEPLEHDDGRAVRFDQDFAATLELERGDGKPVESMADVAVAVWTVETDDGKLEVNTAALNAFAIRLVEWMANTRAPVEGEVVEAFQPRPT